MRRILITGATGNIGAEVIRYLTELTSEAEIIAAVRDIDRAKPKFSQFPDLSFRTFDFEDFNSFEDAFQTIDILFLLRPPHISDVQKYFEPLLAAAKTCGIQQIVFLSVQGAEQSKVIPHNKIERLIQSFGFDYIFVRPSYFMQNLTTTLLPEIVEYRTITLPSANAKFNWVDVQNIGEAAAHLILSFDKYKKDAYEITGQENKSFPEVIDLMNKVLGLNLRFKSLNPISFYFKKKKEGVSSGFALVMTLLHFLPRVQKEPELSDWCKKLTGKEPTSIKSFIEREKDKFL
ncbi:MAG: NmrA family NAD(P)-binding protein [Reichenbachiella sp.]|uniref:NmrA family NAD(P)-binding protein n=1 Tax=Reichenbachiella sp. TaxID=2184521 RepID=UPI0029666A52|nr:NmrA family NAD(P)-binding protein [Reichenbachiella sp.]MDW3208829.1 NmrA family NAD(P)-binding protein [Reichenbachiella sp.]